MNQTSNALFPTRITRLSCFIRWTLLGFVAVIAGYMMAACEHASSVAAVILVGGAVGLTLFASVALLRATVIPRVRDVGLHPAWSLLILLHAIGSLVVLALLFIPTNAFAKPPRFAYPGA